MDLVHIDLSDEPNCIMIAVGPLSYSVPPKAIKDVDENIEHELVLLPEGKTTMLKYMAGSYVLVAEDVNISQMAWLKSKNRLVDMQFQPVEQLIIVTVVLA